MSPPFCFLTNLAIVVLIDSADVDKTFLFYCLASTRLWELRTGSAQAQITIERLREYEVSLAPILIQRRIAGILSAYDDLIENNQRRIKILEEMARLIYREWFVHFRFPGHEKVRFVDSPLGKIPEGWGVKKLGQILQLAYGKALREDDRCPGPVPVFGSSGIVGFHDRALVSGPGIIVGRKGNVGSLFWSDEDFFPIDTVYYVVSELPLRFLYYELHGKNFINNDAAVPGLNRSQAYSLETIVPTMDVIDSFCRHVETINTLASVLRQQNAALRNSRDLLLPRLLSGEVELRNVDAESLQGESDDRTQIEKSVDGSKPAAAEKEDRDKPLQQLALPSIDQTDRTDVLALIRQIFSDGFSCDRDEAIRVIARELGHHRTGHRIQQILSDDLRTAVRRGILDNDNGQLRLLGRSIADYDREFLKKQFLAAIDRGWIERDEAIQTFARWLGFRRTGPIIDETARSLINGLIREGRLESDGPSWIRRLA